jgi:ABC-type multidrug transport system ATPase subunit
MIVSLSIPTVYHLGDGPLIYKIVFSTLAPIIGSLVPLFYTLTITNSIKEDGDLEVYYQSGKNMFGYYIARSIVPLIIATVITAIMVIVYIIYKPYNIEWVITYDTFGVLLNTLTMVFLMSEFILLSLLFFKDGIVVGMLAVLPLLGYGSLTSIYLTRKTLITVLTVLICLITALISKFITNKKFIGHFGPITGSSIITCRNIKFGYKKNKPILKDLQLECEPNEPLGILGHNGVGKTTLLKVIVGLLRENNGSVVINGQQISQMKDILLLTEASNLTPKMTVRENIMFRKLLFDPDGAIQNYTEDNDMVKSYGLTNYLDTKVSDLSSGLKKRVGIALGLMFHPKLVLLDEPTNSIDTQTKQLLMETVILLDEAGRTVITVTHDLEYCFKTCKRVVLIDNGTVSKDVKVSSFNDFDEFQKAVDYDKPVEKLKLSSL